MTTTTKYALRDIRQRDAQPIMCEKVTIDGFDYYVSDEKFSFNEKVFNTQENTIETWLLPHTTTSPCFKKVIATNNPDIELPKVVDEFELFQEEYFKNTSFGERNPKSLYDALKAGYIQSQQTHPFSEQDMIDFANYCLETLFVNNDDTPTTKLFQLWKDQQPITIYYDSGSNNSDNA